MVVKWIQSVLHRSPTVGTPAAETAARPATPSHKELGVEKLKDVAYEVLREDMALRQGALKELEKVGWSLLKRRRLQQKVRSQVQQSLFEGLVDSTEGDLLVDEITERITDVAENDPFYRRLFRFASQDK